MDEALRQRVGEVFHERWSRLGIDGLLQEERDHVLLWCLHVEATTGGLDQYLTNSSGDYAQETIGTLERVGLRKIADVLRKTLAILPGGWCAERAERCRRIASVPDRWDVMTALNNEYDQVVESEPCDDILGESILAAYRRAGLIA